MAAALRDAEKPRSATPRFELGGRLVILPHAYVAHVAQIRPGALIQNGFEGLLLDIDGTLRDYGAREFPAETRRWIDEVRASGIRICLFSNGKPQKVQLAAEEIDAPYVALAYKPSPLRCREALSLLGLPASRVGLVGDQIFADVLAGRLAGLRTILVQPTSRVEPWFTRLKRPFEVPVLWQIRRTPSLHQLFPAS